MLGLQHYPLHSKIDLWFNNWLAIQLVRMPEFALGIRIVPEHKFIDFYLGPLTIAIGRHPIYTDPRWKWWNSNRGFVNCPEEYERFESFFPTLDVEQARVL